MTISVIEKISQSKPSYAIKLFVDNQDRGRMGAQVHKSSVDDTLIAASKCTIFNQKGGNGHTAVNACTARRERLFARSFVALQFLAIIL